MSEAAKSLSVSSTRTVDVSKVASQINAAASTHTVDLAEIASIISVQMFPESARSSQTTSVTPQRSSATLQSSGSSSSSPTASWFSYHTTPTVTATPTGAAATTSSISTPLSLVTSSSDDHKRKLAIILSVVLGVLAIAIIASVMFIVRRYRRKRTFPGRSITPVDDEEIETWRVGSTAGIYPCLGNHRTSNEHQEWSEKMPRRPSIARAPNSRSGLTDETVPGANPFVTPPRRHSGKLQKSPHHSRNNTAWSPRSSVSDRPPTPYQERVQDMQTAGQRRPQMPHMPSRIESFELERSRHLEKWG